jgi:hypothetical protein
LFFGFFCFLFFFYIKFEKLIAQSISTNSNPVISVLHNGHGVLFLFTQLLTKDDIQSTQNICLQFVKQQEL